MIFILESIKLISLVHLFKIQIQINHLDLLLENLQEIIYPLK